MKIRIEGTHRDRLLADGAVLLETVPGSNRVVLGALDIIGGLLVGEPGISGITFAAAGAGLPEWDANLPAAQINATRLVNEVWRQPLDDSAFQYDATTRRLSIRIVIPPGSATGTLRELGLFGGDASELPDTGLLFNYRIHPRIDKAVEVALEREITFDLGLAGWLDSAVEALAGMLSGTERGGIQFWAEGEGDPAWDAAPPAPDPRIRELRRELVRKTTTPVRDLVYDRALHTIRARTTLSYGEAAGILRETGLFGGTNGKRLLAYRTFAPVDRRTPNEMRREFRLTLSGSQTAAVPNVVGRPLADAIAALAAVDLLPGDITETEADPPAGRILRTSPAAGTVVPVASRIALQVTVAPLVIVPRFIGLPLDEAQDSVRALGLELDEPVLVESELAAGTVLDQIPASGERVPAGARVRLTVATPPLVDVPELTSRTAPEADAILNAAGLHLQKELGRQESEATPGTIVAQNPAAGTRVSRGAAIAVTIAVEWSVEVPDLAGQTPEEAAKILRETAEAALRRIGRDTSLPGLSLGQVREKESTVTPGTIIEQDPEAGKRVPFYRSINVVIATPAQVAVPDLTGMARVDAVSKLERARLRVGRIIGRASSSAADTVLAQDPPLGTRVAANTTVDLTVAVAITVEVPVITAMSVQAAAEIVRSRGLTLGEPILGQGNEPAGTVVAQDPPAGAQVAIGSAVRPTVTGRVDVPNLVGLTQADAADRLQQLKLKLVVTGQVVSEAAVGSVIQQQPAAGTSVSLGSAVAVTLAQGVEVPRFTGTLFERSQAVAQAVGLKLRQSLKTSEQQPGTVIDQNPAPSTIVPRSSTIDVVVAQGVAVPEIVGKLQDDAREILRVAGLRMRVTDSVSTNLPAGSIARQNPQTGAIVPLGTEILVVTVSEPLITVPRVTGIQVDEAKQVLARVNLVIEVGSETPSTVQPGLVLSQDPAAGANVRAGSKVVVTIATDRGPTANVRVPAVVGMRVVDATRVLEAAGLRIRANVPVILAIRQQLPAAGTVVPRGTVVAVS
jgi:beta-lactam-binding protein with PASTA domain